jgi:hypothetical protein
VFKNVWATFIGLNVRPTARVVLKAQHMHVWFPDSALGTLDSLEFQAAWSF